MKAATKRGDYRMGGGRRKERGIKGEKLRRINGLQSIC